MPCLLSGSKLLLSEQEKYPVWPFTSSLPSTPSSVPVWGPVSLVSPHTDARLKSTCPRNYRNTNSDRTYIIRKRIAGKERGLKKRAVLVSGKLRLSTDGTRADIVQGLRKGLKVFVTKIGSFLKNLFLVFLGGFSQVRSCAMDSLSLATSCRWVPGKFLSCDNRIQGQVWSSPHIV